MGGQSPPSDGNEPGLGVSGWQRHAALALHSTFREQVVLPTANPSARACPGNVAIPVSPHAGAWLSAIPADVAATLAPDLMHLALRRRLRLPLQGWPAWLPRSCRCAGRPPPRPALVQACWRGEALCLSGHGSKWHAKQSGQAEWFLNNGLPTRPVLQRDAGVRLGPQWPACPRGRFPGWCCNCHCQTARGRTPSRVRPRRTTAPVRAGC